MSLQDRISAQSKLDTDLLLQNDRIGKASRRQENTVLPFNQVDEELLREYNAQFPTGFEYTDEKTGKKKYRKYMLPQDTPELDEVVLQRVLSDADLDLIERDEKSIVSDISNLKDMLKKNILEQKSLRAEMNYSYQNAKQLQPELEDLQQEEYEIRHNIKMLERELKFIDNLKQEDKVKRIENQSINSTVSQENKKKIEKYKEELNLLNNKAFTTEQLPSETEEQYYKRLRNNAEFTEPEENLQNAKQLTLNKFKKSLKELVRNDSKLEQISNTIDPFGEVGNKLKLLKKWNLFKTKYIKVFGNNNSSITVDDIVEFINEFLGNNTSNMVVEEKEDSSDEESVVVPRDEKKEISELTKALMTKYQTAREMRDRLREYNKEARLSGRNDLFQGIITKRRDNIAQQVARKIITNNKTNEEVGFGIKTEKIPEKVTFGKLVLLLHKLYYKNTLAVKHHNMISIAGLKNTKVSEKFVKIIMGMVEGIHPTVSEINGLSVAEKQLYDRLIHLAGLNKMIPHTQDKTVTDLKKRMKLIEAEISAGNNSPILLQELYVIVHSLKDFGILSQKDIKQYLSQF